MLSLPCTAYDRILLCLFLVFLTLFWAFLSFQIHPKLAEEMADKSTIAGVKIDWNEDSDLQSYLNYEVGNVGYNALTENFLRSLSGGNVQYVDTNWAAPRVVTTVLTEMEDDLSVGSASSTINGLYQAITGLNPDYDNYDNDDYNTVLLFVVDNGASLDNAMDQISGLMYSAVEELDDDYATAGAVRVYLKTQKRPKKC